jgi:hypothetical protein
MKAKRLRWVWHVACLEEEMNIFKVIVRKPDGKRLVGRPRHKES